MAGFSVRSACRVGCVVGLVVRLGEPPFFGFVRGDGEEGVGEHGEGDMSVPGVPGADLVVVETDFVLAGSEAFLDGPACPGHVHEFTESCVIGVVAVVEGEFTVVDGPADQEAYS